MRSYRLCIADFVWGARGSPRLHVSDERNGKKLIRRVGADGHKYGRKPIHAVHEGALGYEHLYNKRT